MTATNTEQCHDCGKSFEVVHPLNVRCALCQCRMDHDAIEAVLKATGHVTLATLVMKYADWTCARCGRVRAYNERGSCDVPPTDTRWADDQFCTRKL